jgi:excisionase family DNA binding protein
MMRYLTVSEAAELARCHPKTIRRAYEAGRLRAFRPAHRVLVTEADICAWIEGQAARHEQAIRRTAPRMPKAGDVTALRRMEHAASLKASHEVQ